MVKKRFEKIELANNKDHDGQAKTIAKKSKGSLRAIELEGEKPPLPMPNVPSSKPKSTGPYKIQPPKRLVSPERMRVGISLMMVALVACVILILVGFITRNEKTLRFAFLITMFVGPTLTVYRRAKQSETPDNDDPLAKWRDK